MGPLQLSSQFLVTTRDSRRIQVPRDKMINTFESDMKQDIFGKYVHKKIRSHFIELKPDGNYFLFEGSSGVTGVYEVNGTEITIFGTDSTSRGTIQNGVITDSEGDRWIRAKDKSET